MGKGLNIAEKLLVAASEIEENGKGLFSAEDLVVAAWKKFPDAFGLQGYLDGQGNPIYPNSNRVYAEIMGSKPLRKQGLLQKVGNKMYKLTEAGRARARGARSTNSGPFTQKLTLGREQVDQIRHLFESKAAQKMREGKLEDITFFDACGFWGISPRSGAKDLWSRFAEVQTIVEQGLSTLKSSCAVSIIHGSNPYTADDLQTLQKLHKFLEEKFAEELIVIKKRNDERKL